MFDELSAPQKRLLWSFFLFSLASPMIFIYVNTFIWRIFEDIFMLAIFNIGNYVGTSLGFLINAKLLRFYQAGSLYALGSLLQGIVPVLLVTIGVTDNIGVIAFGLALGIAQGFYWANRNAITSKITCGPLRYRFIGIETFLLIISGVIAPLIIGWFIGMGEIFSSYTVEIAYIIVSIVGFLLLVVTAMLGYSFRIDARKITHLFLRNPSIKWKRQRIIDHVNGIAAGIESVLPLLIILLFLGMEEAVGTVKAITSLLSALFILLISKRVQKHQHATLFSIWLLATAVGAVLFAVFYSTAGALAFVFFTGLVGSLRWSSLTATMYEIIDEEQKGGGDHRFVYLLDRELWLNAGRIVGILLLMALVFVDSAFFVRYGNIVFILIQMITLFFLWKQMRALSTDK